MKRKILFIIAICSTLFLAGCTADVELKLNKNGELEMSFSGISGEAFATFIKSASGIEEGDVVFDVNAISYELIKSGFLDVKVESKNGSDLKISMVEKTGNTLIYESGIIEKNGQELIIRLSPEKIYSFYELADDEIKLFLDMLIAPVFNNEIMTEDEYLETISAFYGESVAEELKDSKFRVNIFQGEEKKVFERTVAQILTLQEVIEIKE